MFVDFIYSIRKTKPYKILGILSAILVPILAFLSTQSMIRYDIEFIFVFQLFWVYILFLCLVIILCILFILLTILSIKAVRKIDLKSEKNNKIADFGYCFCLFYLVYCFIFYVIIIPNSLSYIKKGIDYINNETQNFYSLKNNNIDNLCVSSRENTLNCFAKNIPNGHIDKISNSNVIMTNNRIYYFKPMLIKGEHINASLLQNAEILVSDRLTIIPPVPIAKMFCNKNADKQITGYRLK